MSRSCRPCTPPPALATLNAASMPRFIFWPSSLAAPLNGAEIPNRISLSVTPRMGLLTLLGSCSSGCEIDGSGACCACALADGSATEPVVISVALADGSATEPVVIIVALADGSATEPAAIFVPGTSGLFAGALFAGALFAVSRSDGLEACNVCKYALGKRAFCHSPFAKMANIATSAANPNTNAIRLISAIAASTRRRGGGSADEGAVSDDVT